MTVLEQALSYAERGWPVIPIRGLDAFSQINNHGIGKAPLTEHGHRDASKEATQIMLWWTMWPDANVAIVTGKKSGLIVLDIDVKNRGFASLHYLEKKYGPLPKTVKARSGGGGAHLYFEHPGYEVRGRIGMHPGLDVKADGGAVVSPPSKHKNGNTYAWEEGLGPGEIPVAPLPRWLLKEILTKKAPVKRRKGIKAWYDVLAGK